MATPTLNSEGTSKEVFWNSNQTVAIAPTTSGGATPYRNLDLGVTGQVIKASAGQLYGYYVANQSASWRYLKWYDKATAPTQADTPVFTYPLPPNSAGHRGIPPGVAFAAGISVRASTAIADNDTGAPTANDVVLNAEYR